MHVLCSYPFTKAVKHLIVWASLEAKESKGPAGESKTCENC